MWYDIINSQLYTNLSPQKSVKHYRTSQFTLNTAIRKTENSQAYTWIQLVYGLTWQHVADAMLFHDNLGKPSPER